MAKIKEIIQEKLKEESLVFLIFLSIGVFLILIGIIDQPIKIHGYNIISKNEFRWVAILIGLFCVLAALFLRKNSSQPIKVVQNVENKQEASKKTINCQYYLEVKDKNWMYSLDGKKIVNIGRGESNNIKINDKTVDIYQAAIYTENSRYKIRNCSSQIPIYINSSLVTAPRNLGDNNTIKMGQVELLFRVNKK